MKWLAAILLLFAIPALADVSFLVIGDPQLAFRCSDDESTAWVNYKRLSRADCLSAQADNLHNLLQFAEDANLGFVVVLGDHVDKMSEDDARNAVRDELAGHPKVTVYSVMGNHDIGTASCTTWAKYLLNALNDVSQTRRPIWETWEVDGHYFMGLSSELWSWDLRPCLHLAETTPATTCIDISRATGSACSSGGADDNYGESTCASDEVCSDPEGYAQDQMTALSNLVTTVAADSNAKSFTLFSHVMGWSTSATTQTDDNSWTRIHNSRQCNDGDLDPPYDLCDEVNSGAFNCATIEAGAPGTCDAPVAVEGYDWRNQVEVILDDLPAGMVTQWFAGHSHINEDSSTTPAYAGTTAAGVNGAEVEYDFYITLGTGAPSFGAGYDEGGNARNYLSGRLVSIADDGTVTQRLIPAATQVAPRGYDVKYFDGVENKRWIGP